MEKIISRIKIRSTPFTLCPIPVLFLPFFCGAYLGYKEEEFNWPSYLKACKAQAAPKSLFENQNAVSTHLLLVVWKVFSVLNCVRLTAHFSGGRLHFSSSLQFLFCNFLY